MNFHWPWLERQIQIEGRAEKASLEESEIYFNKRPIGSRFGAIVSEQSSVIECREVLELGLQRSRRSFKVLIRLCQNSGAVTGWFRNGSNSGRVERIGYTIVFSIRDKVLGIGGSTDCHPRGRLVLSFG